MRYTDVWNDLTEKWVLGRYGRSVCDLQTQIYGNGLVDFETNLQQDLMYKGYTIQPYSPKAGTGLSSHEVNQPGSYRDVTLQL
jgi:isoleucyl-tRNA synthetase